MRWFIGVMIFVVLIFVLLFWVAKSASATTVTVTADSKEEVTVGVSFLKKVPLEQTASGIRKAFDFPAPYFGASQINIDVDVNPSVLAIKTGTTEVSFIYNPAIDPAVIDLAGVKKDEFVVPLPKWFTGEADSASIIGFFITNSGGSGTMGLITRTRKIQTDKNGGRFIKLGAHDIVWLKVAPTIAGSGGIICARISAESYFFSYSKDTDVMPVSGDVDFNGQVNLGDVTIVIRTMVGLVNLSPLSTFMADAAEPYDSITPADAVKILRRAIGVL